MRAAPLGPNQWRSVGSVDRDFLEVRACPLAPDQWRTMNSHFLGMSQSSFTLFSSRFRRRFSASWLAPSFGTGSRHRFDHCRRKTCRRPDSGKRPESTTPGPSFGAPVELDLGAVVACNHVGFSTSKLGSKVSTNLGKPQCTTPNAPESQCEPVSRYGSCRESCGNSRAACSGLVKVRVLRRRGQEASV